MLIFGRGGVEFRPSEGGGLGFFDNGNDSEEEEDIGAGVGRRSAAGGSTAGLGFKDLWNGSRDGAD